MPKMRRKADLPTKICATCGRPFTWRKKWARDWDAVKYCSQRCGRARLPSAPRADRHGEPRRPLERRADRKAESLR